MSGCILSTTGSARDFFTFALRGLDNTTILRFWACDLADACREQIVMVVDLVGQSLPHDEAGLLSAHTRNLFDAGVLNRHFHLTWDEVRHPIGE